MQNKVSYHLNLLFSIYRVVLARNRGTRGGTYRGRTSSLIQVERRWYNFDLLPLCLYTSFRVEGERGLIWRGKLRGVEVGWKRRWEGRMEREIEGGVGWRGI